MCVLWQTEIRFILLALLPPATKLGQGNIFRSVCQEFCPQGGHVWQGGHAWQGTAWQGGVRGKGACMAGRGCAWQGVCVVGGGMCGGGVHGGDVAGGMHGGGGVCMACRPPRQALRDTVNERAGILLECVLVWVTLHWQTCVLTQIWIVKVLENGLGTYCFPMLVNSKT